MKVKTAAQYLARFRRTHAVQGSKKRQGLEGAESSDREGVLSEGSVSGEGYGSVESYSDEVSRALSDAEMLIGGLQRKKRLAEEKRERKNGVRRGLAGVVPHARPWRYVGSHRWRKRS